VPTEIKPACAMAQRIRRFYQLTQPQQHALLDVVDEMIEANRLLVPVVPIPPPYPHLHAVK
jgi:hypothetical protein